MHVHRCGGSRVILEDFQHIYLRWTEQTYTLAALTAVLVVCRLVVIATAAVLYKLYFSSSRQT